MLTLFLLLIACGALAVVTASVGLVWSMLSEADQAETADRPLSVSQLLLRDLEKRQLWRALSAWIGSKPLQLEDRRGRERG